MKRPEQHITETKSQRIFENIIPVDWVCRDIKPDYGIDFLVEIFEKGESTGKTFFVQLKGSTQTICNNTFEKQFTIDNLKYYNSLALPVLIVCVSVETKQVWGIWSNNLLNSKKIKDNQKTINLLLDEKFIINEIFFQNISSKLNNLDKIGISININNEIEQLLNQNIINWLNEFYSDTVSTTFNNLPDHLVMNYITIENDNIKININLESSSKEIIVNRLTIDEPFLYKPKFDKSVVNDFNKDILFAIAIELAKYDIKGSLNVLIQIIDKLDFSDHNKYFMLDPLGLLVLAKEKNELYLFNNLVKKIIELNLYDLFFFFDFAYFTIESPILLNYRIENLTNIIGKKIENALTGTCHYNLGNIYKGMTNINEAIYHYFKARKIYPEYLKRDYWWREVAGLLFGKSHYHWSEIFYKKSLESFTELKKDNYDRLEKEDPKEVYLVKALIGDCLFFQSKFKEATIFFEEYLKLNKHHKVEWVLKNMTCIELMNSDLNDVMFNKKDSMKLFENGYQEIDNKKAINIFQNALKLNPLNGLVWFNLGGRFDKEKQLDKSLFAFLITGLIQEWDKEAQFNALMVAMTQNEYNLLQSILLYLVEKHGNLIINDLSDYIMNKKIPLEHKKQTITLFQKMLDTLKNTKYT
jgi:tetratricopeptide (TPR) repeat protein